jgi:hypothetical protein
VSRPVSPLIFMLAWAEYVFVVAVGASLTAVTEIATVSVSDLAPPEPVLPWSLLTTVSVSALRVEFQFETPR